MSRLLHQTVLAVLAAAVLAACPGGAVNAATPTQDPAPAAQAESVHIDGISTLVSR